MQQSELEQMTSKDLRALKDRIDIAIRAAIARSRAPAAAVPAAAAAPTIDLERERDAWQARKRAGGASA